MLATGYKEQVSRNSLLAFSKLCEHKSGKVSAEDQYY
jgi:hypothetical protein